MSLRATVGLRTHTILIVFVIFTLISAFEHSTGRGFTRSIRFLILVTILGSAASEAWARTLSYMPDASHGEGFQRAARRLTWIALAFGAAVGLWLTSAGNRLPARPGWGLVVLVRDLSFWMLVGHVCAAIVWRELMRGLSRR
jgi:hypothetical protein